MLSCCCSWWWLLLLLLASAAACCCVSFSGLTTGQVPGLIWLMYVCRFFFLKLLMTALGFEEAYVGARK